MDFSTLFNSLQGQLGQHLPGILGALVILVGGWFIAVVVRAGLKRLLNAIGVNRHIADSTGQSIDIAGGVSLAAFLIIIVITLIAVFNSLNLNTVSEQEALKKGMEEKAIEFVKKGSEVYQKV